jgi:hypothetical protein
MSLRIVCAVAVGLSTLCGTAGAKDLIAVTDAEFGNGSGASCNATEKVSHDCNGVASCSEEASNGICPGGADPALHQHKRLLVHYKCGTTSAKSIIAGEGQQAQLSCE